MGNGELELLLRLLKAAKAGECPDPDCEICKEKWNTIQEAEAKLEQWRMETKEVKDDRRIKTMSRCLR